MNCDGQDRQFVAALDKRTGKPVWETKRSVPFQVRPDFRKAFSTPALIDVAGKTMLVSTGANQVNAFDPRTGRELVVCAQLWAIRTDGQGDVTGTHVVWKLTRQVGSTPSPVLVKGRLYLITDQGVATCVAAESAR